MFTVGSSVQNRQKLETTPVSSHRQTWSVHSVDYYSAIQWKAVLIQATTWMMQKTWGGFPDQRQLLAYLTQAQGREARLWRGGQLQVPVPSRGPPGSTVIPLPHARTGRGRVPRAPATR